MEIRPKSCERAAQFVSLELDGELSRFERAMLKRHLQRCAPCAAYARDVTGLTELLRAAPVEQIRLPIVFSLQRSWVFRVLPSIAAAAAVAAIGVWFGISSPGNGRVPTHIGTFRSGSGVAVAAVSDDRYDWPAGLPRTVQINQLGPGSLYTGNA
jgi:ferric-dicitrate binding protein FerR (iron transport regulator)